MEDVKELLRDLKKVLEELAALEETSGTTMSLTQEINELYSKLEASIRFEEGTAEFAKAANTAYEDAFRKFRAFPAWSGKIDGDPDLTKETKDKLGTILEGYEACLCQAVNIL